MPSTTELGINGNSKVNNPDTYYQSFDIMSDSQLDRNDTTGIISSGISTNNIKSGLSSLGESPLSDSEMNPIVSVSIGEDIDVLIKMERMNK